LAENISARERALEAVKKIRDGLTLTQRQAKEYDWQVGVWKAYLDHSKSELWKLLQGRP
jgi:hypothetical protein